MEVRKILIVLSASIGGMMLLAILVVILGVPNKNPRVSATSSSLENIGGCPPRNRAYGYGYYKAIYNYDIGGFTNLDRTMKTVCDIKYPGTNCYSGAKSALSNKSKARNCSRKTGQ